MANKNGYLTIYSTDKSEIYGEFGDGEWTTEQTKAGSNHQFSGTLGDGALERFRGLNDQGTSNVCFTFETNGERYSGHAQLLAPEIDSLPGRSVIRIETGDVPVSA